MEGFQVISIVAIAAATLLAHGLLLLNDGMYGDSMLVNGLLKPGRIGFISESSSQVGRPLVGRLIEATAPIKNKILFFRLVGLFAMLLIGELTYLVCLASGLLDPAVCLAVALLATTYTCNQMLIDFTVALLYYFFQAFFLCGVIAALFAIRAETWAWPCWYALAALLFLTAFQFEAQLVYFYAFLVLLAVAGAIDPGGPGTGRPPLALSLCAFALLPPAAWVIKEKLTPRHGHYANYNRLQFDVRHNLKLFARAVRLGVIGAVAEPFRDILGRRRGWIALVPALGAAWILALLEPSVPHRGPAFALGLIAAGAIGLVCGNAPYILVRQPAGLRGWSTKNNALTGLPTALLLAGTLALVLPDRLILPTAGFCSLVFAVYLSRLHLYWIAIWAKHLSFLTRLKRIPGARDIAVFAFRDEHPITMTFDEHQEHYSLALVFMMEWLFGDLDRLVIIQPKPKRFVYNPGEIAAAIHVTTMEYIFTGLEKDGPQASLVLLPGKLALSPAAAGLAYLRHRYAPGGDLAAFLDDLTELEYRELRLYDTDPAASG